MHTARFSAKIAGPGGSWLRAPWADRHQTRRGHGPYRSRFFLGNGPVPVRRSPAQTVLICPGPGTGNPDRFLGGTGEGSERRKIPENFVRIQPAKKKLQPPVQLATCQTGAPVLEGRGEAGRAGPAGRGGGWPGRPPGSPAPDSGAFFGSPTSPGPIVAKFSPHVGTGLDRSWPENQSDRGTGAGTRAE